MPVLFVILLAVASVELTLLTVMSNGGAAWNDRHQLAMVIGFLGFFLVFGILQDFEVFTGRSVVSIVTIWQLRRLWLRLLRDEPTRVPS